MNQPTSTPDQAPAPAPISPPSLNPETWLPKTESMPTEPVKKSGHKTDDIAELEAATPALVKGTGQWVSNKTAAGIENLKTRTLADYRQDGIANNDGNLGRDRDGRIWRKVGTKSSHPWYLRSSLRPK